MAVGVEFFAVVMRVGVDVHALTSVGDYTIPRLSPQAKAALARAARAW